MGELILEGTLVVRASDAKGSPRAPRRLQPRRAARVVAVGERQVSVHAAAKLNLTLALGSRRADGYHEFESLMCTVSLYDRLDIKQTRAGGIDLICDDPALPCERENLVYRAAELLARATGVDTGVKITLSKRIPTEAGLGGGSADAAAALVGLNHLWKLNLPPARLAQLAERLGSDVPFFLFGPLAICTGRGEIVEPLEQRWPFWAVLVKPAIGLSTASVYRHYRAQANSSIGGARRLANRLAELKPSEASPLLFNALEPAAFELAGELKQLHDHLEDLTGSVVRLCGSGSAMFSLFDTAEQAAAVYQRVSQYPDLDAWIVTNNCW